MHIKSSNSTVFSSELSRQSENGLSFRLSNVFLGSKANCFLVLIFVPGSLLNRTTN